MRTIFYAAEGNFGGGGKGTSGGGGGGVTPANVTGFRYSSGSATTDVAATSAQAQTLIGSGVYDASGAAAAVLASSVQTSSLGAGVNTELQKAVNTSGGTQSALGYYGTIYSATSFANLNAYTISGATASISGSAIALSGGSGTYTKALDYSGTGTNAYCTALARWKRSITFTVGTPGSTTYGIGIGLRSTNTISSATYTVLGRIDLSTLASAGNLYIVGTNTNGVTSATLATSATAMTFSASDVIVLTLERNEDTLILTANNVTKASYLTVSYQIPVSYSQTYLLPNTGKFSIFAIGGSQTITADTITSNAVSNPDVVLIGDSKTVGYYAGGYGQSWAAQLQKDFRSITLAGGGDKIEEVTSRLAEIVALNPRNILLNIGRNDYGLAGDSDATVEALYAALVTALTTALPATNIYHLLPLYETVVNQTNFTTYIQTTYPGKCIDAMGVNYSGTASTVLAPDNVHPNAFFHSLIYTAVRNFLGPIINPGMVPYSLENLGNVVLGPPATLDNLLDRLQVSGSVRATNYLSTPNVVSASITLTYNSALYQVDTGTGSTVFTLPTPTGNLGLEFYFKARGTGAATIASASGSQIFDTAAVATKSVAIGSAYHLVCDGTYWNIS